MLSLYRALPDGKPGLDGAASLSTHAVDAIALIERGRAQRLHDEIKEARNE